MQLVLDLFPGGGLLADAFSNVGFSVVKGPDIMFGQDIRGFHVPEGKFDGIIGGPPCQIFSTVAKNGTSSEDFIPEFLRVFKEAKPKWSVMENVIQAHNSESAPSWEYVFLNDWDCGGHTFRKRAFWFYGVSLPDKPEKRPGFPKHSVLATSWKKRYKKTVHSELHWKDAAFLQGYEEKANAIMSHRPSMMSQKHWSRFCIHILGNGVPRALGEYVANHVKAQTEVKNV